MTQQHLEIIHGGPFARRPAPLSCQPWAGLARATAFGCQWMPKWTGPGAAATVLQVPKKAKQKPSQFAIPVLG